MSTASELPSLRLDASREEALARAVAIVADAWRSFDRPRPGQPAVDERLGELLRSALPARGSSALGALEDAARILDTSLAQPRPRFFAFQALFDNFAFTSAAFFKRQGDGRLDRVDYA